MSAEFYRLTKAGPVIEPEKDVITELENLLEEARRGEIKGFVYALVQRNDSVGHGHARGCADRHLMVAAAAALNWRVNKIAWDE